MASLQGLNQTFEKLFTDAEALDKSRGKHYAPLFDEQLFHCKSLLLRPCIEEAKETLDDLLAAQQSGTQQTHTDTSRIEYLSERLVDQLSAIQRELGTTSLRQSEQKPTSNYRKSLKELYKDLEQHEEWERRLKEMVSAKQQALNHADPQHFTQAQQVLQTTQERLQRCRASKYKIENQINYREKHRNV